MPSHDNPPLPKALLGAFVLILLLGIPALSQPKSSNSPPPAEDGEKSFHSLFNGRDLAGWRTVGSAPWKVKDGVIEGGQDGDPKRSGLLMTEQQYQDFELRLEFMIDEHGKYNSGVYLRQTADKASRTGYQVNIGRGQAEEYTAGIFTDHWLAKGDEHDTIRKPGAWNSLWIKAQREHVVVHLNGVKVADYRDANPPDRFLQKGAIALQTYGAQGHAGWVKFRNIRVRVID
jgi:hypothetical protein